MAKKMYLLTLDYPCVTFPIGIYPSAKAALAVVAGSVPPTWNGRDNDDLPNDVYNALNDNRANYFVDLGMKENWVPLGYAVQEFEDGQAGSFATIEPYNPREPVLPGQKEDETPIDGTQELVF